MKTLLKLACLCALAFLAVPAAAQKAPTYQGSTGQVKEAQGVFTVATTPKTVAAGDPQDARNYGSVTIQVSGLSGGDSIAVTGSVDGTNYLIQRTIITDGIYSCLPGGMQYKYAKAGSASTPVVTYSAGGACSPQGAIPAISTPATGSVTSSAVTSTSGTTPSFSTGTATIPFTPQLGRSINLRLWTTNSAVFSCQLFNSIDAGTTKLPLTFFDGTVLGGPYAVPVNSNITSESDPLVSEWLVCAVTSGTLNYRIANP